MWLSILGPDTVISMTIILREEEKSQYIMDQTNNFKSESKRFSYI
jgi:hypothetical protein